MIIFVRGLKYLKWPGKYDHLESHCASVKCIPYMCNMMNNIKQEKRKEMLCDENKHLTQWKQVNKKRQ